MGGGDVDLRGSFSLSGSLGKINISKFKKYGL